MTEPDLNINTKDFIKEIERLPSIWNSEIPEYSDRDVRKMAWRSLVRKFGGNEVQTAAEKNAIGIKLQKKWYNIRDCFFRELRRQNSQTPNTTASLNRTPFIHFNRLLFLKNTPEGSTLNNSNISEENQPDNDRQDSPRKRMRRDFTSSIIEVLRQSIDLRHTANTNNDPDRLFLLSLTDDFKKVPDRNKMILKADLIRLIHKAQSSNLAPERTDPYWEPPISNSYLIPTRDASKSNSEKKSTVINTRTKTSLRSLPTASPATSESSQDSVIEQMIAEEVSVIKTEVDALCD